MVLYRASTHFLKSKGVPACPFSIVALEGPLEGPRKARWPRNTMLILIVILCYVDPNCYIVFFNFVSVTILLMN